MLFYKQNLDISRRMSRLNFLISVGLILTFAGFVTAQSTDVSRCFQFTWLGPRFNNESVFLNATCADATMLANGIPCEKPLVVSHDGSWPDVDYIWKNYPDVSCILADTDVCAQYTFYFNGQVENSTYFCTRAVDQFGNAITSGCHQQVNGSSITEICLCRSLPGHPPCNNSFVPSVNFLTIAVTAMVFLIQFAVNTA